MITSFADRETERLSQRNPVRRCPSELHRVRLRTLVQLNVVTALDEVRVPPGNRLETLTGDGAGEYRTRVHA